ncbi:hypothetical protein ACFWDQ_22420 [Streptomyces sp. NPDC060053]|uniref:hypothetical protein n=1 Tax=Streptomyces sp. NPDC060053 TaxID=3347047 RepID=UPI00369A0CCC
MLLARYWNDDTGRYSDRPGVSATVRAHCDAVEIADPLLGAAPGQMTAAEHAERLRVSRGVHRPAPVHSPMFTMPHQGLS